MFLQPSEVGFLRHLKEARVPLVEFEFPAKRIFNIQSQLEKLIGQNYYLNKVTSPTSIAYEPRFVLIWSNLSLLRMDIDRIYKHMPLTVYGLSSTSTNLTS